MESRLDRIAELECLLKKASQLGEIKAVEVFENAIRVERALIRLDWETVRAVRNANGFKLYPLEWDDVCDAFDYELPLDLQSQDDFESRLRELCESLYGWKLYDCCPKCGKGILIPVWRSPYQYTPFCGCSEFPNCDYSADREGKPIGKPVSE